MHAAKHLILIIFLLKASNTLLAMKALQARQYLVAKEGLKSINGNNTAKANTVSDSTKATLDTHDLSIKTPPAKYLQNILYNNNVIGFAMYKDDDQGDRQILVSLNAYKNKNIEAYLKELLQPKVNAAKIEQSKNAIQEIDPTQLSFGKRLISSGSMHLMKNGQNIMSVIYSDNQITENDGVIRTLGTVVADEDQRGKGYGSYLMQSLIAKSRKDNISSIELSSTPKAIKFYEKLGFVRQDQNAEPKMILKIK